MCTLAPVFGSTGSTFPRRLKSLFYTGLGIKVGICFAAGARPVKRTIQRELESALAKVQTEVLLTPAHSAVNLIVSNTAAVMTTLHCRYAIRTLRESSSVGFSTALTCNLDSVDTIPFVLASTGDAPGLLRGGGHSGGDGCDRPRRPCYRPGVLPCSGW